MLGDNIRIISECEDSINVSFLLPLTSQNEESDTIVVKIPVNNEYFRLNQRNCSVELHTNNMQKKIENVCKFMIYMHRW